MRAKGYFTKFLILLLGFSLGWGICLITQPKTGEQRDDSPDSAVLGTKYYFGEEARSSAAIAGVKMPTNAIDCFYGINGLKPVIEYIAFTVPTNEVWSCVKSVTGKQQADIQTLLSFQGPAQIGKEGYGTLLFNLTGVTTTKGVVWAIKNDLQGNCVVDENSGRIFIIID